MIDKVGTNRFVQRFVKKTGDPKFFDKINHRLPLIESAYVTSAYVTVIGLNKKIPKERKKPLIWQSIIGGSVGVLASKKLDDIVKKHSNKLIIEMEKLNLPKAKNTIGGLRMLFPILITTLILRYGVSVLSVPMSTQITKIQDKFHKKVDN